MEAFALAKKVMEALGDAPSYTAKAALEISQALIREEDAKQVCSIYEAASQSNPESSLVGQDG